MKVFLRTWLTGYVSLARFIAALEGKPAPLWGVSAQGLRVLMDSLLLYLPLALLGRQPSTPSAIPIFPTQTYYATMIWLQPVFIFLQWLMLCAVMHTVLRLVRQRSDIDLIINLTGMAALVVGAFLVGWDWLYLLLGGQSDIILGISHWIFSLWGALITVLGLKRYLNVPYWVGGLLYLLTALIAYPQAMLLIRGPV